MSKLMGKKFFTILISKILFIITSRYNQPVLDDIPYQLAYEIFKHIRLSSIKRSAQAYANAHTGQSLCCWHTQSLGVDEHSDGNLDQSKLHSHEINDKSKLSSHEINDKSKLSSYEIKDKSKLSSYEINDQSKLSSHEFNDQSKLSSQ